MIPLAAELKLPENYAERKAEIQENLADVKRRLAVACEEAKRKPEDVLLVVVTKTYPWSDILALYELGERDFGENRVQELQAKMAEEALPQTEIHWHQIGTLQRNKVKYISGKTSLIHSVISLDLAREISRKALQNGLTENILLQVNITNEASKHGFKREELLASLEELAGLEGLRLRGLMTMAEEGVSEERLEETFLAAKALLAEARDRLPSPQRETFTELSMGMTQDFETAVRCGATIVRIGSAVLGQRKSRISTAENA